jgi:ABC-2 type transport system permease protein
VFLGAVVISSYDKVVVPFFGKGLPIEYELTRSVQTVTRRERHKLGILTTDAGVLSGSREWQIVTELKKQYDVEEVSPASEIEADKFDALLAILPSSLTDFEMDNLVAYVKAGHPVLIFDDPYPLTFSTNYGVTNAPRQPKPDPSAQFRMFGGGGGGPPPKADNGMATRLLRALNIRWRYDRVVFDQANPHPEFGMLPKEYVFITRDSGNPKAFNPDSPMTKDLQELIVLYAGTVEPGVSDDKEIKYQPLLATGSASGLLDWDEFVEEAPGNPFTPQPPNWLRAENELKREVEDRTHTVAARITSDKRGAKLNAIFVSDIDMISDFFFQERNRGNLDIEFDNVSFVLNAVDVLVGDDTFLELRSRRARHRTLQLVDANKREFYEAANKAEVKANQEADEELERRRKQLGERVEQIKNDPNLDDVAKSQLVMQAERAEQQRLSLAEAQIEQRKKEDVRKIRANTNRQTQSLESFIRILVILLSPIPAVVLGVGVFVYRFFSEQSTVGARRRPGR